VYLVAPSVCNSCKYSKIQYLIGKSNQINASLVIFYIHRQSYENFCKHILFTVLYKTRDIKYLSHLMQMRKMSFGKAIGRKML